MNIATLTSKNQITLPVDIVRQFDLSPLRQFVVQKRGGSIVLTPQPSTMDRMEILWAQNKKLIQKPLEEMELKAAKQAAREALVESRLKKLKQQSS